MVVKNKKDTKKTEKKVSSSVTKDEMKIEINKVIDDFHNILQSHKRIINKLCTRMGIEKL
tara:strand:- start:1127 stop:1306 length:180 start_codon:yes stop_codon:yes gene_type:complete